MKNQMKSQGLRQYKINDRWKWMVRATAATATAAAATTAAQAGWVTDNQTGNYLDSSAGNQLNADLLHDGVPIVQFTNVYNNKFSNATNHENTVQLRIPHSPSYIFNKKGATVNLAHFVTARAWNYKASGYTGGAAAARHDSNTDASKSGTKSQVHAKVKLPIEFTDPNVNGGAETIGILKITEFASNITNDARITLDSFSYDNLTPVPEPGNAVAALSLLALGAGGILVRRARKKAAN